MTDYIVDITELKKYMVEKKLDKVISLSEASGIDRNILGLILNGKVRPSERVMSALIKTLEIPTNKAGSIFFKPNLLNA